jgi:hypothetical protein
VKESFKSDLLGNGLGNPHHHQVLWQIVKEGNVNIPPDNKPIPQLTQQPHQSGSLPNPMDIFQTHNSLPIRGLRTHQGLGSTPLFTDHSPSFRGFLELAFS